MALKKNIQNNTIVYSFDNFETEFVVQNPDQCNIYL